jgi:MSHA biogenesis protein MshO
VKGVTLVELVVTIALLGILAAVASIYIAPALEAYFASQRRAELADVTDTATRRMMRDIRLALPNSARVAAVGGDRFLEILLTKNGGRYRAVNDDDNPVATSENPLLFNGSDDGIFDVYETAAALADIPVDQRPQAGDYVVIHNLGVTGANAYDGIAAASPNIGQISGFVFGGGGLANENRITLTPATQFALESPGNRFFVVSGPVSFSCVGAGMDGSGNGTGTLRRWSGYAIQAAQPSASPGGTNALLANNVSACELKYTTTLALESRGLVAVRVAITRANETVTLYYEAHVNNVP